MKENVHLDSLFRIYPESGDGAFLEVGIDGDGMVYVKTTNENSEIYFGKVNFTVQKEVAEKLAEALKVLC
jgi:hypothetical protein